MRLYQPENTPQANLEILAANSYLGRFFVQGFFMQEPGDKVYVQAYGLEGRSEGSRNRTLQQNEDGSVSTKVFDMAKQVGDPALTLYRAMDSVNGIHVVSNGNQTTTAIEYLRQGKSFEEAINTRDYEPDEPNYTPRISGYIDAEQSKFGISIIRKLAVSRLAVRTLFTEQSPEIELTPEVGYAVHTYQGDGNPLPPFDEAPFKLPLRDTAQTMAELMWDNLDTNNRVAVAAKVFTSTSQDIFIINRHEGSN
ncbi:MAG: IMP cyclohydrolase [Candidatus Saccharimonadales bacterium]